MAIGDDRDLRAHLDPGVGHGAVRQEQRGFVKRGFRIAAAEPAWPDADQRGGHHGCAHDIEPQQRDPRLAKLGRQADHRAGIGDARRLRHFRIKRLVKAKRTAGADRQFGRAVDPAHRAVKRGQRRSIDQVDGETQRHAHRNGNGGERKARRVKSPFPADQPAQRQPACQQAGFNRVHAPPARRRAIRRHPGATRGPQSPRRHPNA